MWNYEEKHGYRRKTRLLWAMLILAALFLSLLALFPTLTGNDVADGAIGIVLGLYIASHPATNAVDLLFFDRSGLNDLLAGWAGVRWLALNSAVLLAGWAVIAVGATRFMGRQF